jgi:hypothetical protein
MARAGGRPKGLPKTGGRKKGVVNKVTREVRDWARALFEDPQVQAKTLSMMQDMTIPSGIYNELLHYAYGKPKEMVELSGPNGGPVQTQAIDPDTLSPETLKRILAESKKPKEQVG